MPPASYSFLDVVIIDAVRERFAAGDALAILSTDLEQVIWANGPGAALFGYPDIDAILGASPQLGFATKRQISATSGFPAIGRDRAILVRMATGMTSRAVGFLASTVTLPDGETAILLAVPAATGGARSDKEIAERAIGGFNEAGHFVAFVDGRGAIEAASPGFAALGLTSETLAGMVERLSGADGRIAKRMLPGANGTLPAGMARITETRHLLVVIDESQTGGDSVDAQAGVKETAPGDAALPAETAVVMEAPEATAEPIAAVDGETAAIDLAEEDPALDDAGLPIAAAEAAAEKGAIAEPEGRTDQTHDDWYFSGEGEASQGAAEQEAEAARVTEPGVADKPADAEAEAVAALPEIAELAEAGIETPGVRAADDYQADETPDVPVAEQAAVATAEAATAVTEPEAAEEAAMAPKLDRASAPVRFVWRTDADGKFSQISPEFSRAVGAEAADVVGRQFQDVADAFGLDPAGEIAGLLARRDTWSGRSVLWPVAGTDLKIPVDLAALPVYGRDRTFEGFRGFGVARAGDAVVDPEGVGMTLVAAPSEAAEAPTDAEAAEASKVEAANDAAKPADPFEGEVPALSIVPMQERRFTDKVIRLAEHRQPANDKGLSTGERIAFQQIGERLKKDAAAKLEAAGAGQAEAPERPDAGEAANDRAERVATGDRAEAIGDTAEATGSDAAMAALTDEPAGADSEDVSRLLIIDGASEADIAAEEPQVESEAEPAAFSSAAGTGSAGTEASGETLDAEAAAYSEAAAQIAATIAEAQAAPAADGALVEVSPEIGDDSEAVSEPSLIDGSDAASRADDFSDEAAAEDIATETTQPVAGQPHGDAETPSPEPVSAVTEAAEPPSAAAEAKPETPVAEPQTAGRKPARPGMSLLDFAQWNRDDEAVSVAGADVAAPDNASEDGATAGETPETEAPADAAKVTADVAGEKDRVGAETVAASEATAGQAEPFVDQGAEAAAKADDQDVVAEEEPTSGDAAEPAATIEAEEADEQPVAEAPEEAAEPSTPEEPRSAPEAPARRPEAPPLRAEGFTPSAFSSGHSARQSGGVDILEKLPVPVLVHSGDALHYANAEFLALTGYASVDELSEAGGIGALFADPYEDEDTPERSDRQLRLRTHSGEEFPVEAFLQSVPWNDGKALLLVVSRAKEGAFGAATASQSPLIAELEARVAEMRTIIDTATDGVVLISRDGTIRSISRPAEALFGFDSDEVAGKAFASLFAIESQRAARDYLNGLSDNGVASVLNDGREVIGRESQGRFIPLFMTIGKLPSDSGYCAVVRDITQWKRAEEELTQARAVAERASSHKTDFLARVSHEIRTPLNAIIGFSELMMDERFGPVANDRYRDYLRDINRSGNHVLDLVNDLLDISKIEAGQQEMAYEAVSLNDTLAETVAMMQPQANRERVIIRSSFASKLPDVVADLRSVRQIALNILSNAIRYTQAGGQVIVSTAYEVTGDIVMRVRDTGIGMSQSEIEQALKPFKQINSLKRARGDGTGLGLPLTKAMVEANRAKFVINSTPGEGTLVEVTFPSTRVLAD